MKFNWRCLFFHDWVHKLHFDPKSDYQTILQTCIKCNKKKLFIGSGTVFYDVKTTRRCSTYTESLLADILFIAKIAYEHESKK